MPSIRYERINAWHHSLMDIKRPNNFRRGIFHFLLFTLIPWSNSANRRHVTKDNWFSFQNFLARWQRLTEIDTGISIFSRYVASNNYFIYIIFIPQIWQVSVIFWTQLLLLIHCIWVVIRSCEILIPWIVKSGQFLIIYNEYKWWRQKYIMNYFF